MRGGSEVPHGVEAWLAEQDMSWVVASKVRTLERYLRREGPDEVRKTVTPLTSTWHKPSRVVDEPRLHLQPSVALEAVLAPRAAVYAGRLKAEAEGRDPDYPFVMRPALADSW